MTHASDIHLNLGIFPAFYYGLKFLQEDWKPTQVASEVNPPSSAPTGISLP